MRPWVAEVGELKLRTLQKLEPSMGYNPKLGINKFQWPPLVQQNYQEASIYNGPGWAKKFSVPVSYTTLQFLF